VAEGGGLLNRMQPSQPVPHGTAECEFLRLSWLLAPSWVPPIPARPSLSGANSGANE
jgi:hypothetical protein